MRSLLLAYTCLCTLAWQPSSQQSKRRRVAPSIAMDGGFSDKLSATGHQNTLINDFCTQRAIQTQMCYYKMAHDIHTPDFLMEFGDFKGLAEYHGYGAMKTHSLDFLRKLSSEPPLTLNIQISLGKQGSSHNPYLEEKYHEYLHEIVPCEVAQRIMAVREVIAAEWVKDLVPLRNTGARDVWINKLEHTVDPETPHYPDFEQEEDDSASAYRGGNNDLLQRLATRIATRRRIVSLKEKGEGGAQARFLEQHYQEFGVQLFEEGDAGFGTAEKFLSEMMSSGSSVAIDAYSGVMRVRREVVAEWIEALEPSPAMVELKLSIKRTLMLDKIYAQPAEDFSALKNLGVNVPEGSVPTNQVLNLAPGSMVGTMDASEPMQ